MTNFLTVETITHQDIELLLAEAGAAGDADTVALARTALGRKAARPKALTALRYGTHLIGPGKARRGWAQVGAHGACTRYLGRSMRDAALRLVVDIINAARDQARPV